MYFITQKLMDDTLDCLACMYLSTVDYPFDPVNIKSAKKFAKSRFRALCQTLNITKVEIEEEN